MASFSFLLSKLAALLLTSTLLFTQQCHAGYGIADDCIYVREFSHQPGNEDQRAFLTQAFTNAKALANFGQINTIRGQSADGDQLYEWLFGPEDLEDVRGDVRRSLSGISQNASPVQGELLGGGPERADVEVYCTLNHLKEKTDENGEKRWYSTIHKEFLTAKFECARALAWTIEPDLEPQPDYIQICPWFLDYAMSKEFQFQSQFEPGKIGTYIKKLKLDRLATWVKYTPIDLFQLFDKVIVHELSHTRRGRAKLDVGGFSGYGWKNCRKLSTERGEETGADKNADSIALFASISGLIAKGGKIQENGKFTEGEGGEGGGGATKRSAEVLDESGEPELFPESPVVEETRTGQFNASILKGRPLF